MKKINFLVSALIVLSATQVKGQVRIGGDVDPNPSAILDLNTTDSSNNGTQGLALPRVNGTASVSNPVKGLFVYNTADDAVYYYNGASWLKIDNTTYTVDGTTLSLDGTTLRVKNGGIDANQLAAGAVTASKLNDMSAANGQVLAYNGSAWEPTSLNLSGSIERPTVPATGCDGSIIYIGPFDYVSGSVSGDVAKNVTDATNGGDHVTLPTLGSAPTDANFNHNPSYYLCIYKSNSTSSTWADAVNGCANATYDGKTDWYLPNARELKAVYDALGANGGDHLSFYSLVNNGAMLSYSLPMASNYYWSSTELSAAGAWYVYFSNGSYNSHNKTSNYYVRCVRRI